MKNWRRNKDNARNHSRFVCRIWCRISWFLRRGVPWYRLFLLQKTYFGTCVSSYLTKADCRVESVNPANLCRQIWIPGVALQNLRQSDIVCNSTVRADDSERVALP